EYGPQISDAMEVVEAEPRIPPTKTAALAQKVAREAQRLGLVASGLGQSGFCRVNLYNSGGYMHKHMDSKKCFGPVIACCSLLSDATMTFYDTGGSAYGLAKVRDTATVVIPRRSLYFMTGPSRSQWQHGIKKDHCPKERLSLTFRSVLPDAPRAVCCKGLLLSSCLLDFMTGDKVRAQSCRETLRQRLQEARIDVEWPGEGGSSSSSAPATSGTGSLPQDMTSGHTLEGLYALPAWQHRWTMQSHLDGVRCVFLDDKNSLLVSCGEDVVVKCWDLSSIWQMPGADELEPYAAFRGHSAPVFTLAFRPQDRTLFSAGMDSTIRAWLLPESGEGILRRGELVGHTDAVWSLQHHAHLPYLATASSDGLVGLWSAEDDKEKPKPREERWMDEAKITASERAWSEAVTSLEAVMNKTIQDGNATLQDFRSSTDKKRYQKEMAILDKRVCWATAVVDGSIQSKIDEQKTLLGKPQAAAAAATTTSDMSALSRAAPTWEELKSIATLRMDANKYRTCATCLCPGRPLQADALTRGGCRMQASLMLRQPGGGSSEELDVPTTVCWVPADTTRLLAGYVSSRIAVFDVRKGTQVLDLLPPGDRGGGASASAAVTSSCARNFGQLMATGHVDGRARLIDLSSGRFVGELPEHPDVVTSVSLDHTK
ncbi:STRN3, partial [Symbiodinium sp. KB8]